MESWYWLNENSRGFLDRGYLAPGQTPEERIRVIAETAEKYLGRKGFADKFYEYMGKGWISLASPVWSNFGIKKGLPISCFGSYVDDHMGSILYTNAEVGMMSKFGGGCSGYFGAVRPRGADISDNGHSSGSVHFMQFLDIGTEGNPIQKLTHAVTVGDKWMEEMIGGDEVKRAIWARVIQRRGEMGYPYILFKDTANKNTVDVYKDKGLTIYASNMCSEIMLPSREDWSFVCCLSSLNLMHYEDWKDTDLVETMIAFLDAVMEDFIVKLEELRDHEDPERRRSFSFMERAYNFAKANRA